MGVYDKMEFHLKCKDCGVTDQIIFLDQGVGWGFPEWITTGTLTHFNATIIDGEVTKPKVEIKDCKSCGGSNIETEIK